MDKIIFEGLIEEKNPDLVNFPAVGFAIQEPGPPEMVATKMIEAATKVLGTPPTHFYFEENIEGYVLWSQK